MTDPATSYEGYVIAYAAAMLAASPAWSYACGDSVPPRSRIILIDGGDPSVTGDAIARNIDGEDIDEAPPFAQISIREPMKEDLIGVGVYRRSGTVSIGLTIKAPEGYHPAQAGTWATNVIGGIKKDIMSQQGQVGKLARITVTSEQITILDGSSAFAGCFQTIITISWSA